MHGLSHVVITCGRGWLSFFISVMRTLNRPTGRDSDYSVTMALQFIREEIRMIKPQLKEFMRRIDKDSVAIIPAAREAVRSHDTHYRYRQNSDFFYLTGFEEPEAIAVIAPSRDKKFTLFVRPRDLDQEIWYGYRAGVEGAQRDYSADQAFTIDQFDEKLTEILDGPRVLYYAFGHTDSGIDRKIIEQLRMMRESNRKPFEPPATIIDPSTILHEMRVLKSTMVCG